MRTLHPKRWLHFSWNVTNTCNLRCPHCYIDATKVARDDQLTLKEGFKFIEELASLSRYYDLVNLVFSGGEPLTRVPEVYELVSYANEKGIVPSMGTNGTLLTEEKVKKLVECGLSSIGVSLDSVKPEVHDRFRGVSGTWVRAIAGIKRAVDYNIRVQIHFTLTQWNWMELEDIVKLALKLGVKTVRVFGIVETGKAKHMVHKELKNIPYEKVWHDIIRLSTEYEITIRPTCMPEFERYLRSLGETLSPGDLLKLQTQGCMAGINYGRLSYNGDITPCPYLPLKVGNIREDSFVSIWLNSPVLKRLRNRNNLKGKCRICPYREVCGGCRARAYSYYNNYLEEDPHCKFDPKVLYEVS